MIIANSNDFSDGVWIDYTTNLNWNLLADGTRSISGPITTDAISIATTKTLALEGGTELASFAKLAGTG